MGEPNLLPVRLLQPEDWGGVEVLEGEYLDTPVSLILVRYTSGTDPCKTDEQCCALVKDMQWRHRKMLRYTDIAHNFLIAGDGTVYEGRGWNTRWQVIDEKDRKYHGKSIDIAYIGDYTKEDPPRIMTKAVKDFIDFGVEMKYITKRYEIKEMNKKGKSIRK